MPQNQRETDPETALVGALGILLACIVATIQFFKTLFVGKSKEDIKRTSKILVIVTIINLIIFTCIFAYSSSKNVGGSLQHIASVWEASETNKK